MADSEESNSSSSEEDQIESMALSREKRVNAGNRMARLLEAEDEDDFYKTTYGGFEEVSYQLGFLWLISKHSISL